MKAVIQRVLNSNVTVNEETISSIGKGLLVLIGISKEDTKNDVDYMVQKILKIRAFDNEGKKWSCSVVEKDYEILCVSQFTLCHTLKGNKLDFHNAMSSVDSEKLYSEFIVSLRSNYKPKMIKDGKFGAYMQVNLTNDGPVTFELESPKCTLDTNNKKNKNSTTSC